MTTQMTERDKKLLYMLGFIVIVFAFIIIADRPLFRTIRATNKEIEVEQETHDTIQRKLEQMDTVKHYRDEISQKVDLYAQRYYPMMESTQIDELLTGYVLENGLKSQNLYIDMPQSAIVLPPYARSKAAAKLAEENAQEAASSDQQMQAVTDSLTSGSSVDFEQSSDQVSDTTLSGVYAASVALTAFGSENRLKMLLDKLFADQSIRIADYSWGAPQGLGFTYLDGEVVELTENDRQLTVHLQVLMYDENAYVATMPSETEE